MNTARKIIDMIDMYSYDSGYAAGYSEGRDDGYEIGYSECMNDLRRGRKRRHTNRKRQLYLIKQRAVGVLCLALTAFSVAVLNGDATFALLGVPIGCGLIFCNWGI